MKQINDIDSHAFLAVVPTVLKKDHIVPKHDSSSNFALLQLSMPQGSILGLVLFSPFHLPLGTILGKHGISLNFSKQPNKYCLIVNVWQSFNLFHLYVCFYAEVI